MIRRTNVHRRSRAKQKAPYYPRARDSFPSSISIDPANLTAIVVAVNERLVVAPGLPLWRAFNSAAPNDTDPIVTLDILSAAVLRANFGGAFSPYDRLMVPAADPSIRNYTGGFITAGSFIAFTPADIVPLSLVGNDLAGTIVITCPVPITVFGNAAGYVLTPLIGPVVPPDSTAQTGAAEYTLTFPLGTTPVGGSLDIPPFEPAVRGLDNAYIAPLAYPVT